MRSAAADEERSDAAIQKPLMGMEWTATAQKTTHPEALRFLPLLIEGTGPRDDATI